MKTGQCSQQGFALVEYVVLIIVVITALLAFRGYVQRAYQGQMVKAGEGFAYGRQYDPSDTMACAYDDAIYGWYSTACYSHQYAQDACNISATPLDCASNAMKACTNGCQVDGAFNSVNSVNSTTP